MQWVTYRLSLFVVFLNKRIVYADVKFFFSFCILILDHISCFVDVVYEFTNIFSTWNFGLNQIIWLINSSILLFCSLKYIGCFDTEAVYIGYCIVPILYLMRRGGCVWLLMWYELEILVLLSFGGIKIIF